MKIAYLEIRNLDSHERKALIGSESVYCQAITTMRPNAEEKGIRRCRPPKARATKVH